MAGQSIWDQILGSIEAKVGRHSFHTWFKPTSLLTDDGLRLPARCPTCCSPNGSRNTTPSFCLKR